MKELFKETWSDYWKNLFNPNAPITRDNYLRERWYRLVFVLPAALIWLFISLNGVRFSDEYYNMSEKAQIAIDNKENFYNAVIYMILLLILFICSYALELRMFKHRGKSPKLYLILNALFFLVGFSYCFITYFTGHSVQLFWILLPFLIVNFACEGNVRSRREEDWEEQ